MIEYTKQTGENSTTLFLTGNLTLAEAEELCVVLTGLLSETDTVEIDVSSAAETDVSCLQLFCASHRKAMTLGKSVCLGTQWSSPFVRAAEDSGFLRQAGCELDREKKCLWLKELSR